MNQTKVVVGAYCSPSFSWVETRDNGMVWNNLISYILNEIGPKMGGLDFLPEDPNENFTGTFSPSGQRIVDGRIDMSSNLLRIIWRWYQHFDYSRPIIYVDTVLLSARKVDNLQIMDNIFDLWSYFLFLMMVLLSCVLFFVFNAKHDCKRSANGGSIFLALGLLLKQNIGLDHSTLQNFRVKLMVFLVALNGMLFTTIYSSKLISVLSVVEETRVINTLEDVL